MTITEPGPLGSSRLVQAWKRRSPAIFRNRALRAGTTGEWPALRQAPTEGTVICVTIVYGYGFGMFGTIGATAATSIALAIFAFQTIVSTIWLKVFAYGPLEWIWRQLTYRQRLDLRQTRRPIQRSTMTGV